MACGCGTIYTDEEIDDWIVQSQTSHKLMEKVREDTRAMQEATGDDLLDRVFSMDSWRERHLIFLSNENVARAGTILQKHVARLVETHIKAQMQDATPFEPIVIKQKQSVPVY